LWEEGYFLKAISALARVLGYGLMGLSICLSVVFYLNSNQQTVYGFRVKEISNLFGDCAVVVGITAVSIWIVRKGYIELKKRKIPDYDITRAMLLFLRKHHILLGWTTILTATAHGTYYVMRYPNKQFEIFTGLFAWSVLAILVMVGVFLDYRLKERLRTKRIRVYHIVLAVLFMAGIAVHVM
jgi:hypothetical protein